MKQSSLQRKTPLKAKTPLTAKKPWKPKKSKAAKAREFSSKVRKAIIERDGEMCVRCGRPAVHIHHTTYRSQGGQGTVGNGVCVCLTCHDLAHKSREVREWFEEYAKELMPRSIEED